LVPSRSLGHKTKILFPTFGPLPQFFNTNRAHIMRSPWFTLISKFYAKVCVVDFFLQTLWCFSVVFVLQIPHRCNKSYLESLNILLQTFSLKCQRSTFKEIKLHYTP
jgi:hypothetical protein